VLIHPVAGDSELARDLLRVEPWHWLSRPRASSLLTEHLEDARDNGIADSLGDRLDHSWIELERLRRDHAGEFGSHRLNVSTAVRGRSRDVLGGENAPLGAYLVGRMSRNQRLAEAIRSSGRSVDDLAAEIGAHPKTVERWVSAGRLPHAAARAKLARLLGVPVPMLWPEVPGAAFGVSEVIGIYTTRNELSPSTVGSMLDASTRQIDVLVYSGMWLWDTIPRFRERLLERLAAGVAVRVCLGDPDSDAVHLRGREEGSGDGMASRCKIAIGYAKPILEVEPRAVRLTTATLYCSIFRFDDELLANTHFWGNPAAESPVLHLRHRGDGGIAANIVRSFERVWGRAQSLAG
jgi:transcriptional regulator with XRE-family HTH domain